MRSRLAFTLIELVVVVLVIGILTAVAAPRMFNTTEDAKESSLRNALQTLRNAIDYHRAYKRSYPGDAGSQADLKLDLEPYLRRFPKNPFKQSANVDVQTSGIALNSTVSGDVGWRYDNKTGQIIANSNGTTSDGKRYYEL